METDIKAPFYNEQSPRPVILSPVAMDRHRAHRAHRPMAGRLPAQATGIATAFDRARLCAGGKRGAPHRIKRPGSRRTLTPDPPRPDQTQQSHRKLDRLVRGRNNARPTEHRPTKTEIYGTPRVWGGNSQCRRQKVREDTILRNGVKSKVWQRQYRGPSAPQRFHRFER